MPPPPSDRHCADLAMPVFPCLPWSSVSRERGRGSAQGGSALIVPAPALGPRCPCGRLLDQIPPQAVASLHPDRAWFSSPVRAFHRHLTSLYEHRIFHFSRRRFLPLVNDCRLPVVELTDIPAHPYPVFRAGFEEPGRPRLQLETDGAPFEFVPPRQGHRHGQDCVPGLERAAAHQRLRTSGTDRRTPVIRLWRCLLFCPIIVFIGQNERTGAEGEEHG